MTRSGYNNLTPSARALVIFISLFFLLLSINVLHPRTQSHIHTPPADLFYGLGNDRYWSWIAPPLALLSRTFAFA